jgi:hypothetical protein
MGKSSALILKLRSGFEAMYLIVYGDWRLPWVTVEKFGGILCCCRGDFQRQSACHCRAMERLVGGFLSLVNFVASVPNSIRVLTVEGWIAMETVFAGRKISAVPGIPTVGSMVLRCRLDFGLFFSDAISCACRSSDGLFCGFSGGCSDPVLAVDFPYSLLAR